MRSVDISRYAANHVLTDRGLLNEAMVEIDSGVVTKIVEFSALLHETPGTVFLNGTLAGSGYKPISVGYSGSLEINRKIIKL